MVKRHIPRAIDIVLVQLDAGVKAYELPPDGVPGLFERLSAGQALFGPPEELPASGAIYLVRIGFVAAYDAVVGRGLALAEVLDGAGGANRFGQFQLRPAPVMELGGLLVERVAEPVVAEEPDDDAVFFVLEETTAGRRW